MTKKGKSKVDKEALDRVSRKVLAFRPSKHRKKSKVKKTKPPPN